MTQDDLKLVLEALKWCHGGEPCGTAEAIAVVEKALMQEQELTNIERHETNIQKFLGAPQQPEQEPVATVTSELGNPDVSMSWWHEPALPVGTKLYTKEKNT